MSELKLNNRIVGYEEVPARLLFPAQHNWRVHPKSQQNALAAVIREVGFYDPIKVRRNESGDLEIIDGHLRQELISAAIGPDTLVPVIITNLNEAEAKKANLTHDPLGAMAETDTLKLDALMREVQTADGDLAKMLEELATSNGLIPPDIEDGEGGTRGMGGDADAQTDRAEELREKWETATGQLWLIGKHRLLCGDSTKREDVERVMGGEKAECVFTDPPYGVSVAAKNRMLNEKAGGKGGHPSRNESNIEDDDLSPTELKERLLPAFVNVRSIAAREDCSYYVCSPQLGDLFMMMMIVMEEAGLKPRHVLIWKKNQPTFSMNRLDYDYQHEPIIFTWTKKHNRYDKGEHRTSVWEVDKPRESKEHPTMKPVALYVNAYLNNSDTGSVVFEPYAGSGTAFLAAQNIDRVCRGIEISPAYVAVILERMKTAFPDITIRLSE